MVSAATLRDVAQMAGVSIGTASQALNNRPNVSPETRIRVIEAAKALGYQVKESAGMAANETISTIGMLTKHDYGRGHEEAGVNPFYSHIEKGIENECRRRNISLMYAAVEVDHRNCPMVWPAMIHEQRIDGFILLGTFIESEHEVFPKQGNLPVVLVDGYAPHLTLDSVLTDNFHGAESAVQYLINAGHREIGLIGSSDEAPPSILERRAGYRRTLLKNGIERSYIFNSPMGRDEASEAAQRMLKENPQITAIFCCNDDAAIGVLNVLREMKLNVPDDISVVGFDNIDLAKEIHPALTTVHVPKTWMGVLGVRHLVDRILNPEQPQIRTVVSTHLIVRESVRLVQQAVAV